MNSEITRRRTFLVQRKNAGQRLTIGFTCIADFRSFIGQEYTAGIMKACADYDINFINMSEAIKYSLFDDIDFITHYLKKFRFMKAPLLDGLITWASSLAGYLPNPQIIERFKSLNPLPMVDIGYLDIPGVPSMRIDNRTSLHQVMDHLVKVHNYTRFAFICAGSSRPHAERMGFFRDEIRARNLPFTEKTLYVTKSLEPVDISEQVEKLCQNFDLHGKKELDAIVTSSDIIASDIIGQLEKRGIHVPSDVAVTGFNNQYQGITALSPVTTINLEYFKRGYAAVEQLIDRIIEPTAPIENQLMPTSLIIRESCGCYEHSILEAGRHAPLDSFTVPESAGSEEEARTYTLNQISTIFAPFPHQVKLDLVDAIFDDIYEEPDPPHLLNWFRRMIRQKDEFGGSGMDFQEKITDTRRVVLQMVKDDFHQHIHMEDIFNQLRVLFSVNTEYEMLSRKESSYFFNNMTHIALSFASATNGKAIQNVLRYQLNEMEIPGIILALSDNMTRDLEPCAIEMVIPEDETVQTKLPYKVYDPAIFPKSFLPKNRRYSVMLELLYSADRYFGYAFFFMENRNIALYDGVRQLLSHALSGVYLKEGRTKEHSMMLNTEQLSSILHIKTEAADAALRSKNRLTVHQITNYLVEHLDEMTDLNKMAEDLSVSKSHLVRQAKELTGYTIQSLHEKLKIEQAKNMLQMENIKLSDIAMRLGFQNPNYFSNVFKKNTGISPRAWAKKEH